MNNNLIKIYDEDKETVKEMIKTVVRLYLRTNSSLEALAVFVKKYNLRPEDLEEILQDTRIIDIFNEEENRLNFLKMNEDSTISYGEFVYQTVLERLNAYNAKKNAIISARKSEIRQEAAKNYMAILQKLKNDEYDFSFVSPKKNDQETFLAYAALTFRLNLNTVARILSVSPEEAWQRLMNVHQLRGALQFLFSDNYNKDEEESINEFKEYLVNLLKARMDTLIDENNHVYVDTLNVVYGPDIKTLVNRRTGEKRKDEEKRILVEYQLKYALSNSEMNSLFGGNNSYGSYHNSIKEFVKTDEDLNNRYEALMETVKIREAQEARYGKGQR